MQIELMIDGKKKLFSTSFVPMLAKRQFMKLEAEAEEREKDENPLTIEEVLEHDDKKLTILSDVVFGGQFTLEQAYAGADETYLRNKLFEAVYGIKPKRKTEQEENEGNPMNRG